MKHIHRFIFVFCYLIPILGFGQTESKNTGETLPAEIQTFYANTNLVNALTTSSEKSKLVHFLEDGATENAPSSKREFYVFELLKQVVGKEVTNSTAMPNTFNSQYQISSSNIYEIQNWEKSKGCIYVTIHTSNIGIEDNIKMIELYDAGKFDKSLGELSSPEFVATEIHTWILIEKKWYKNEVALVLTN